MAHEQLTFDDEYPLSPQEQEFLWAIWDDAVDMETQATGRPRGEVEAECARLGITIAVDGKKVFLKPDQK